MHRSNIWMFANANVVYVLHRSVLRATRSLKMARFTTEKSVFVSLPFCWRRPRQELRMLVARGKGSAATRSACYVWLGNSSVRRVLFIRTSIYKISNNLLLSLRTSSSSASTARVHLLSNRASPKNFTCALRKVPRVVECLFSSFAKLLLLDTFCVTLEINDFATSVFKFSRRIKLRYSWCRLQARNRNFTRTYGTPFSDKRLSSTCTSFYQLFITNHKLTFHKLIWYTLWLILLYNKNKYIIKHTKYLCTKLTNKYITVNFTDRWR